MLTRSQFRRLALAAALLLGGAFAVNAAEMPRTVDPMPSSISAEALRTMLQGMGFTEVGEVEKSGNFFSTDARWEGRWVQLSIDSRNGGVVDRLAGAESVGAVAGKSDDQLRDALIGLGYTEVGAIEREGNIISTTALRGGKPVNVRIDARHGGISQELADGGMAIGQPRPGMTLAEMKRQLAPLGYSDASNLEQDGNIYRLDALKGGDWVKLRVHASHGGVEVVK